MWAATSPSVVAASPSTRSPMARGTPYPTVTAAGSWATRWPRRDGRRAASKVATRDTVKLVQIGDALRPVVTPTTADARGVNPVCTRSPKPCPFHEVTLTDAIARKKPIVLAVSTPGFCQTAICGPVLELLVDLAPTLGRFQIVHAEVYVEPNKKSSGAPKTTDTITTYGLDYEPSLYVADADAIVRSRLDFSWDSAELKSALALVS